jgi:hypothetical protein
LTIQKSSSGSKFKTGFSDPVVLWPLWAAITCPVLVLRGTDSDILTAETARDRVRSTPDGRRFKNTGPHRQPRARRRHCGPAIAWLPAARCDRGFINQAKSIMRRRAGIIHHCLKQQGGLACSDQGLVLPALIAPHPLIWACADPTFENSLNSCRRRCDIGVPISRPG